MGVLKKLTDEYFGNTIREEDIHPFESYLKNVKWVDLGHRKYLFAETDFESNTFCTKELVKICEIVGGDYKFVEREEFIWLLKRDNIQMEEKNGLIHKIIVSNKKSEIEIKIPDRLSGSKFRFFYGFINKNYSTDTNLYYYTFGFENTSDIETLKIERVYSDIIDGPVSDCGNYGIKLMKPKHPKKKQS